jgi:hypothetical protein
MFQWINDNPYTCPLLMMLQGWIKWQTWCYGYSGWVLLSGRHSRATCIFPDWMVLYECRFWNSKLGSKLRGVAGYDQLEYRLKNQNDS